MTHQQSTTSTMLRSKLYLFVLVVAVLSHPTLASNYYNNNYNKNYNNNNNYNSNNNNNYNNNNNNYNNYNNDDGKKNDDGNKNNDDGKGGDDYYADDGAAAQTDDGANVWKDYSNDDWAKTNMQKDDDLFHWNTNVGFDGVSIMPVSCVN